MARPLAWLDVFTATPMAGNPLAVVHEADGLDEAAMHAFARETNLSETTFVQTATVEGADYRNRIWMPAAELDFAGHPSLGTAVAVAHARGEREASYVQQTRAGLQPVDVRFEGDAAYASMLQAPASFGDVLDAGEVMAAAGLDPADADAGLPCQLVSTGLLHLMAPVRDEATLRGAAPDTERMTSLLGASGATCLYLAAVDGEHADARSFFLQDGNVREDPATGSAAGPLMAFVHARTGAPQLRIAQGVAMGRPSVIKCATEGDRTRVGGSVVVLAVGEVAL
ncbi:PhzF family phenazine biosynthesis protein [Capillimicrobium parvum]|uniref:Trans-2,3-dihydro-3-hydroxyanthranilate isomerase n=1 Tax=Capillimicrobium parvum TaxID=2884022 RepID=A0A9E6XSG6_9ACTN|nr:PhzF family phenazine biosynthesis protein [Capillimicrobium parvum]UGS33905.1 Trans-2,3-dihydro-3-hydroxyanthranilate isomerase [Capillimicrobium parvum]